MPGRDEGKMLRSTHPQFIPGTNQLLICTNDIENNSEGGSMIYTVNGFAKGHQSYQFQQMQIFKNKLMIKDINKKSGDSLSINNPSL